MFPIAGALFASWVLDLSLLVFAPINYITSIILVLWLVVTIPVPIFLAALYRVMTRGSNRLLMRQFQNGAYRDERCTACSGGIQGLDPKWGEWGPIARRLFNSPADDRGMFTAMIRVRLCRTCGGTEYVTSGNKHEDNGLEEIR
jgi:hypothetical protein